MLVKSYKSDMVNPAIYWRVCDFIQGRNPIEDWRAKDLSENGRFAFNAMLKNIVKVENHLEWGARDLKGAPKKENILELKFIADKRQYRVAFIFQPGREVILLIGFYHKQKVYYPPNAIDTARTRASAFRSNKAGKIDRAIQFDI